LEEIKGGAWRGRHDIGQRISRTGEGTYDSDTALYFIDIHHHPNPPRHHWSVQQHRLKEKDEALERLRRTTSELRQAIGIPLATGGITPQTLESGKGDET
jgi:hypothetical protein